jgi:hypothetical protein
MVVTSGIRRFLFEYTVRAEKDVCGLEEKDEVRI